jgi:hypothetical protein
MKQYPLKAYNMSAPAAYIQADADKVVICPALKLAAVASNFDATAARSTPGGAMLQTHMLPTRQTKKAPKVFVYHFHHQKRGIDVAGELGTIDEKVSVEKLVLVLVYNNVTPTFPFPLVALPRRTLLASRRTVARFLSYGVTIKDPTYIGITTYRSPSLK